MLPTDLPIQYATCPRCSFLSFERLNTYAHCVDCSYIEEYTSSAPLIPDWAINALRGLDLSKTDNLTEDASVGDDEMSSDLEETAEEVA